MKGTSTELTLLSVFFILVSGLPLRRMIGLGAQAQTYKCKTDKDCERQCDPRGCIKSCLELPSKCFNGLCACPFDPDQSATAILRNSTCTLDGDCLRFCPSECNFRSCLKGKCEWGCR